MLVKLPVSALSAFSAVVGLLVSNSGSVADIAGVFVGFLLVSAGASVLNHVQDRSKDRQMARTCNRPVATGRIGPGQAVLLSLLCLCFGGLVLVWMFPIAVFVCAAFGVLVYNGLYPVLRGRSWAGVLVGALSGVAPVAGGWLAGSVTMHDGRFISFVAFSYGWQVPHFWLLMLKFGDQYREAGLPTPFSRFTKAQVGRITFIWIAGLAGLTLCLPLFGLIAPRLLMLPPACLSVFLVLKAVPLARSTEVRRVADMMFPLVTGHALLVMACLATGAILTKSFF